MKIELREYVEMQPNGDRAITLTPSSRFEVVLVDDANGEQKLSTFNQFDPWWTSVKRREPIYHEAKTYAAGIAKSLKCEVIERKFTQKREVKATWEEV